MPAWKAPPPGTTTPPCAWSPGGLGLGRQPSRASTRAGASRWWRPNDGQGEGRGEWAAVPTARRLAGPAAYLRPGSLRKHAAGYGRWLAWLAATGRLDPDAAPASRVTREAILERDHPRLAIR